MASFLHQRHSGSWEQSASERAKLAPTLCAVQTGSVPAATSVQKPGSAKRCTHQEAAQAFGKSYSQRAPSKEGRAQSDPGPAGENRSQLRSQGIPGVVGRDWVSPINQVLLPLSTHLLSLCSCKGWLLAYFILRSPNPSLLPPAPLTLTVALPAPRPQSPPQTVWCT